MNRSPLPRANRPPSSTAVASFWGTQAVFQHVKGVRNVTAGYSGGEADAAHYEIVGSGQTGHAESVKIVYDRSQITYGQLLRVFFSIAHDPTQFNRQGPDYGTQYRSAIFTANDQQKQIATAYIAQLQSAKSFSQPMVTEVAPVVTQLRTTGLPAAVEYSGLEVNESTLMLPPTVMVV